jgi:hypothetical protein
MDFRVLLLLYFMDLLYYRVYYSVLLLLYYRDLLYYLLYYRVYFGDLLFNSVYCIDLLYYRSLLMNKLD